MGYKHHGGGKVCQKMGAGMEKLFVTGASGFLGSRIAKYYNGKYEVCAPAHGEVDITDEKGVTLALEQFMPDVVVHCAAISDASGVELKYKYRRGTEEILSWSIAPLFPT